MTNTSEFLGERHQPLAAGLLIAVTAAVALTGCQGATPNTPNSPNSSEAALPAYNPTTPRDIGKAVLATVHVAVRTAIKPNGDNIYTGSGTAVTIGDETWTNVVTAEHITDQTYGNCSGTQIDFPPGHWRVSPQDRSAYTSSAALQSPVSPFPITTYNPNRSDTSLIEPIDTSYTNTLPVQSAVALRPGDSIDEIGYGTKNSPTASNPRERSATVVPGQVIKVNSSGAVTFIFRFSPDPTKNISVGDSGGTIVQDRDGQAAYAGNLVAGETTNSGELQSLTAKQVSSLFDVNLPAADAHMDFGVGYFDEVDTESAERISRQLLRCGN